MNEAISSKNINKDLSVDVARDIIKIINGIPIKDSLSYLNGLTMALVKFVQGIKENCELSDEDALEKLIFSWLSATDPATGLNFSKFISTDCIDIDFDSI